MRRSGGFTLLEVMVALAVLATSLVVLLEVATQNVRATNHSKMTTAATFLARGKMADIEQQTLELGFGDIDQQDSGTFDEQGFPQLGWTSSIEKVELPANVAQQTQDQSTRAMQSTRDPMQAMTGFLGGMLSSFIDPIRIGLEESVRRVTLRVTWSEPGRSEQSVEVVTFMTDPSKLDLALGAVGALGAAGVQPGTPPPSPSPTAPVSPMSPVPPLR